MTWATLAVSIVAVIVAGAALYFHFPAEARERKREQRESAAEARAVAAETRAQEAESREQARRRQEEIEAQTTRMGRPTTDLLGREPGPARAYRFRVTNIGRSAIWDLEPTLVDNSGQVVSEPLPLRYLNGLQSREREDFVMKVAAQTIRNPLFLRYEWGDDYGRREHVSDVEIPDT